MGGDFSFSSSAGSNSFSQYLINHQFYAFRIIKGVHILFLSLRAFHEPPLAQLAGRSAGHDERIEDNCFAICRRCQSGLQFLDGLVKLYLRII